MNNNSDFTEFSKQSPKGILVIYISLLYKTLKVSWILLFLFLRKFSELSNQKLFYIFMAIGVFLLFLLVRAYLDYKNFQFKIENNHFVLKQGILKKTNTSISFDRIQNINFKQNIIQQLINVYEVSVETAGSKDTEIAIKALPFDKAQALKEQMSVKAMTAESSIIEEEKNPFLIINFKELLKVSLTENHLQSLLIFIALLFGIYQQLSDAFDGLGRKEDFDSYLDIESNAMYGSIIVFLILFVLLFIVALVSSFVRILLFHFNLTVFIKNESFEINQGLLTKKSIILKKEKVQSITVSTNPIKKKLGISFVTFKQAVSGKVNEKKNKLIRLVGCQYHQVLQIKELLFDFQSVENSEKYNSNTYFKSRMYFRSFLGLLIFNSILMVVLQNANWLWFNLILFPLVILLIRLKFKKTFYSFDDEVLLIGKGRIETHIIYLPFFKVQNIKMKQTLFQQRKDVVDIILQTASGKIKIPCIEKERATQIYNYTVYKVEKSTELWM